MNQNVNDGKLWLLKNCIVFEPRPVRVITRNDIRLFSVNRSGELHRTSLATLPMSHLHSQAPALAR
jgi:hypothetical protein